MVKVLYIAGWGRSGTTILDNILGSFDSVFSVGELYYLWRRGLGQGRRCGCGEKLAECPLWREVLHVAYRGRKPESKKINTIQHQKIRVRDTRRLWRDDLDDDTSRYRDEVGRLYQAIASVTGAELIVDSSKTPPGAAVLSKVEGVEPYLLHMVRDPRAVAYSWTRPKVQPDRLIPRQMSSHSAAESSVSWVAWNLLTEEMARNLYPGRARKLRYEDFVADPQGAVAALLEFTGVGAHGDPFRGQSTVELSGNHTVSGNPGRFRTGTVVLRADDAWRGSQSRRQRLISTTVSLPLLRRYGYRVQR
jgi:hypothetical protein